MRKLHLGETTVERCVEAEGPSFHPGFIFPELDPERTFRLLRLVAVLVWSVALAGIAAWVFVEQRPPDSVRVENGIVVEDGDLNVEGDLTLDFSDG